MPCARRGLPPPLRHVGLFQPPGWLAAVCLSWQGLQSPRPCAGSLTSIPAACRSRRLSGWWSATDDHARWQSVQMGSRARTARRNRWCPVVLYGLPSGRRCLSLAARRRAVQVGHRLPVVMMAGQSMQVRPARGTVGQKWMRVALLWAQTWTVHATVSMVRPARRWRGRRGSLAARSAPSRDGCWRCRRGRTPRLSAGSR